MAWVVDTSVVVDLGTRFQGSPKPNSVWRFPTLDCGGDFHTDPAHVCPEADAILQRSGS